ncbi:hypothetical protein PIROE2DRAFT_17735 [Piromyces sp. E2]|nr:hypothetical protein PIROE2DRAFT_17735 [Piromyces sp. E2]|eukprot:OUM57320.1 hypothetical protein PIROE2DRAFT_17735 [Piromyces sp. E2]
MEMIKNVQVGYFRIKLYNKIDNINFFEAVSIDLEFSYPTVNFWVNTPYKIK